MQSRTSTLALVLGAVMGGLIVGLFPAEPRWLWSLVGGVTGGALGAAAAGIASLRWHWSLRVLTISVLLLVGFFSLFLVVGRQAVTDPRNFQINSPGS